MKIFLRVPLPSVAGNGNMWHYLKQKIFKSAEELSTVWQCFDRILPGVQTDVGRNLGFFPKLLCCALGNGNCGGFSSTNLTSSWERCFVKRFQDCLISALVAPLQRKKRVKSVVSQMEFDRSLEG